MTTAAIIAKPGMRRRRLPLAEEVLALAQLLYKGGMTSKSVAKPETLAVKIVAGFEVGLSPIAACNNIMIVNGRATIYGDGALALVRNSGLLLSIDERIEGDDVEACAVCTVHRKGEPAPREFRFYVTDAMRAKLWGSDGPWRTYPMRMLAMRARAFALRDTFTDVLNGLGICEEQQDHEDKPADGVTITPTVPDGQIPPVNSTEVAVSDAEVLVNEETLEKIAEARGPWLRWLKCDYNNPDVVRHEWQGKLRFYNVESATQLTQSMAETLLRDLIREANPQPEVPEEFPDARDLKPVA